MNIQILNKVENIVPKKKLLLMKEFKSCLLLTRQKASSCGKGLIFVIDVRDISNFLVFSHQYSTQQFFQATGCFSTQTEAHWGKTNDACHFDFYQTLERMFAMLGFQTHNPCIESPHCYLLSYQDSSPVTSGSLLVLSYYEI